MSWAIVLVLGHPAPVSDDTGRIGPLVKPVLTHTGQPDPHDPSRSSRCPHTTPLEGMHTMLTIGPWTLDPRTSTVLAHIPVLGSRFRISTRAAPQRLTAPRHHSAPRQRSTSLHSGTALRFSAPRTSLRGTLLHLSMHRSAPLHLAAPRCMRSAAPCARRSAYRAKCWIEALTESSGCQLRYGVLA